MSTMLPPPSPLQSTSGGGLPPSGPPLVGIQSATDLDVLCGRGVTTNRHPGNTKFRSLVGCNKEVYVSSTKKQKMGISRSIVTAVRGLGGRFLELDRETGLYYDIGDKKAVEKCSQALRDGAAALRKQLSEDLNDPDFLNAVFDGASETTAPPAAVNGPAKNQKAKKGHRRVKSTPVIVSQSYEARRKSREQRRAAEPGLQGSASNIFAAAEPGAIFAAAFDSSEYDDILPPLPPPQPRKHHRSHRRVHSSTSAPVFGGSSAPVFGGGYGGGDAHHPLRADDPPFLYPEQETFSFHQSPPPDHHPPFMTNEAPPRLEHVEFGSKQGDDDILLHEPILDIPFTDYDDAPIDVLSGDEDDILASLVPDENLLASLMASEEELLPDDNEQAAEKQVLAV